MATSIFQLFGEIFIDNNKANKGIDETTKKGQSLGKKLKESFSTATKSALGFNVGVAAVGAAAIKIFKNSYDAAANFEKGMSNIATLLDGNVDAKIAALGGEIKTLAGDVGVSANELTDGMYQVISAFGETADSASILEIAAKSAKAGNATTTESINLLSAVTKGYGDTSAEAMEKASDLAFLTVKLGQTTYPELAASMGKVIPLAATMKVSQEELFASMATLTGVTGNAAEVTTQMRGTLQGLMQPTSAMSKAIKSLGYENGQAMIESLGLQGTLDALKKSVNNDEIAFASLFGSVEAKNAVLALTGTQADNFTKKLKEMENASGTTETAFSKATDNMQNRMEKIKAKAEVMLITIGEKLLIPILDLVMKLMDPLMIILEQILTPLFDIVNKILEPMMELLNSILTPLIDIIQQILEPLSEILNDILTPLIEIIKTVAGVITNALQKAFESLKPVIDGIKKAFGGIITFLEGVFTGSWEKVWQGISDFFGGIWDGLVTLVKTPLNWIIDMVNGVIDWLNTIKLPDWLGGWGFNIQKLEHLATGGTAIDEGYAMVGEKGPEILRMPRGAQVIPLTDEQKKIPQKLGFGNKTEAKDGTEIHIHIHDAKIMNERDIDWFMDIAVKRLKTMGVSLA